MREDVLLLESQTLKATGLAMDSLTVYRQLLEGDRVIVRLRALINCCLQDRMELSAFLDHYGDFFAALADSGADSLEDYLIEAILFHDNSFTRSLEMERCIPSLLAQAAAHDLDCLQQMEGLVPAVFKAHAVKHCCRSESESTMVKKITEWQPCRARQVSGTKATNSVLSRDSNLTKDQDHERLPLAPVGVVDRYEGLRNGIMASSRWSDRLDDLMAFHRQYGAGILARYRAFYWDHTAGCLRGITDPDPVTLSDLIGYEAERTDVIENTLQFLDGWPANNVLLYGDRGTGKSSTVKALLNEYQERGLRMVEVPKTQLFDFPDIIRYLKVRGEKFIVFVDDLSFEDSESSYTALKAVLEGGLEHRPGNVLIYATSNRRHLIRERFDDREGLQSAHVEDQVRAKDTVQEKLSLSDRFGITVIFKTPEQDRYLEIVEGIVAKRGLQIDREQLQRAALQWERWHNGRSPRTARQFVDWLEGKVKSKV